jgi:hypothetical protein
MLLHSFSRRFGLGSALLRIRRAIDHGPTVEVNVFLAKRRHMRMLTAFRPLDSGAGSLDCFMLLNEARIWEGLWSLYSFRHYFGPCRIVVLNDGTLSPSSISLLRMMFPGIFVPDCDANDTESDSFLMRRGLKLCREWRRSFVFFRKLADTVRLRQAERIVLLDSDCLHFDVPAEVIDWAVRSKRVRYIADSNKHSLCTTPAKLNTLCGFQVPDYFCAGYLCLPANALDLYRVEGYLGEECFERQLSTKRFSHVAEQTLYAMEAAVIGADILPANYATCPDLDFQQVTMGHFCGGSYKRTWFYTKGLPLVGCRISRCSHP